MTIPILLLKEGPEKEGDEVKEGEPLGWDFLQTSKAMLVLKGSLSILFSGPNNLGVPSSKQVVRSGTLWGSPEELSLPQLRQLQKPKPAAALTSAPLTSARLKVCVVGGGPSGLACCRSLCDAGIQVVLIQESRGKAVEDHLEPGNVWECLGSGKGS